MRGDAMNRKDAERMAFITGAVFAAFLNVLLDHGTESRFQRMYDVADCQWTGIGYEPVYRENVAPKPPVPTASPASNDDSSEGSNGDQ